MTGSNGNLMGNLPILDGTNWGEWQIQMQVVFKFQDVLEIVECGIAEPEKQSSDSQKAIYKDAKKCDCKALFLIHQSVDNAHFQKIAHAQIAKETWGILERAYSGDAKLKKVKLQTLKRQYEMIQLEAIEKVTDYFTRILSITNLMKGCVGKLDDQMIVEKILRSLSPRFDYIVCAIEESKDLENMKIEELQGSLEAHEQRLKDRDSERSTNQALQAYSSKGKGKGKWNSAKREGNHKTQGKNSEESQSETRESSGQHKNGGLIMHQRKYALEVLKRFRMEECNLAKSPFEFGLKLDASLDERPVDSTLFKQMVGSLRYLCHSRPYIAYGVGLISKYMNDPRTSHMAAARRLLRYVKGTLDYGLLFPKADQNEGIKLIGFSDADWSGDVEDSKSTTGYVFKLFGSTICWSSKKQEDVGLSTCELEYMAAAAAACQAAWLESLFAELKIQLDLVVQLNMDNKSAICLANNPIAHGRTKHIGTKYHYLRDQVRKGRISLIYCRSEEQEADILTKALRGEKFSNMHSSNVCSSIKVVSNL